MFPVVNDQATILVEQSNIALGDLEYLSGTTNGFSTKVKKLSEFNNKNLEQVELLVGEAIGRTDLIESFKLSLEKLRDQETARKPFIENLEEQVQKVRACFATLQSLQCSLTCFHSYSETLTRRIDNLSQVLANANGDVEHQNLSEEDESDDCVEETLQDKLASLQKLRQEKENLLANIDQRRSEQQRKKEEIWNQTETLENVKSIALQEYERALTSVREKEMKLDIARKKLADLTEQQIAEFERVSAKQHTLDYLKTAMRIATGDISAYAAFLDRRKVEPRDPYPLVDPEWKLNLQDAGVFYQNVTALDALPLNCKDANTFSTAAVASTKHDSFSDGASFWVKKEAGGCTAKLRSKGTENVGQYHTGSFDSQKYVHKSEQVNGSDPAELEFKFPRPPIRFRSPVAEGKEEHHHSNHTEDADIEMSVWSINASQDI